MVGAPAPHQGLYRQKDPHQSIPGYPSGQPIDLFFWNRGQAVQEDWLDFIVTEIGVNFVDETAGILGGFGKFDDDGMELGNVGGQMVKVKVAEVDLGWGRVFHWDPCVTAG